MTPTVGTATSRERGRNSGAAAKRDHDVSAREVSLDALTVDTDDGTAEQVIVLPEASPQHVGRRPWSSVVETLTQEFAEIIDPDVVERMTAAARHVLERSRTPATPEAVERLAREQLRARLAPSVRHRR